MLRTRNFDFPENPLKISSSTSSEQKPKNLVVLDGSPDWLSKYLDYSKTLVFKQLFWKLYVERFGTYGIAVNQACTTKIVPLKLEHKSAASELERRSASLNYHIESPSI